MSAGVRCTPCAAIVRSPQKPIDSRNAVGVALYLSRAILTSSRVSARWMTTGARSRVATARISLSVAASSVYIECGAIAGTMSSSPDHCRMNDVARAIPSAGVFASGTGNWMIVCPRTPRMPASLVALAISSSK